MTPRLLARACTAVVLGAALAVVGAAGPAQADEGEPRPTVSVTPDGQSSGQVGGTQTSTQTSPGTSGSTPSSASSGSSGSSSPSGSGTNEFIPGFPTAGPGTGSCDPANYPGGYSEDFAVPSPCIQPEPTDPEDPQAPVAPVITTQMVTEAARVTAPVTPPHVEPGTRSYVNIPNNYWTDAPTVQSSVTVLGTTIPLTWTPTGTTWSFGDGSTATGEGIEDAGLGAAGAIEHSYARQGSYDITTSTSYDLTFVIPGQGAQTIALVSPPSPPVTLPVSEIQTRVSYAR